MKRKSKPWPNTENVIEAGEYETENKHSWTEETDRGS